MIINKIDKFDILLWVVIIVLFGSLICMSVLSFFAHKNRPEYCASIHPEYSTPKLKNDCITVLCNKEYSFYKDNEEVCYENYLYRNSY